MVSPQPTIELMLRFSLPLGKIMGVDVRLHLSFLILLAAAMAYGTAETGYASRGFGLFAALVFAVLVRETARCIAAAYVGLRVRALFLLPVGGVMALAPAESGAQPSTRALAVAAPLANFGMALLILGLSYGSTSGINLLAQPWISPGHVLRTFVWMQIVVGLVNLLPSATLPTRQMLRAAQTSAPGGGVSKTRMGGPAFSLMTGLGTAMLLAGFVTASLWPVLLGCFLLLGSQLQPQRAAGAEAGAGAANEAGNDDLRVEEVMLTDFTLLSSSDTLRGALARTVHSAQDVFPILRGNRLVGSVSRQTLAEQLQIEGDSYVQGAMNRGLQVVGPREPLVAALQRSGGQGLPEFIPVAEDGRMVGILTPQSLPRAIHLATQTRPKPEAREPR